MKRFIYLLYCLFFVVGTYANNERIDVFAIVDDENDIVPEESEHLLESKMQQILAFNGYGSYDRQNRFIMVAKADILQKDILPTTPAKISQKVEITFIIGDVIENKIYSTSSIDLSGIGTNETKAWQATLKSLKPASPVFKKMLDETRIKIEGYYAAHCHSILSSATTLASTGHFDEAIFNLTTVPDICHDCFMKVQDEIRLIYQQKINSEGEILLSKARQIWSSNRSKEAAVQASELISKIDPCSSGYAEALDLSKEISDKLSADAERQWQFKLQKYNDEKALKERKQEYDQQYRMHIIDAARSVGEKWAENQPQTKIYLNW